MDRRILKLPKLVKVWSYDDFRVLQRSLRKLTGHNLISVKDVGFNNKGYGNYVGLVYLNIGPKPTKAEILKLAKAQKIKLED